MGGIPEVALSSGGRSMPVIGMGTASYPPASEEAFHSAMLEAIGLGYRHFDTASIYGTEQRLGRAIAEAIQLGLVRREELFITSKLWGTDAYGDRVVPALRESLRNLQLDYLDLYLVHWPFSLKPTGFKFPINKDDIIPIDLKSVWEAMQECQRLGLAKSIGVSNFSCKKLEHVLSVAAIPPAVNQVEMHPVWQQKKLMNFCKDKGIQVCAYSPLGANGTPWGTNQVMECDVLKKIALAKGKSTAQVALRWIYEQGAGMVVKSFKEERMKENIDIFDWEISKEELHEISQIPQRKGVSGEEFVSAHGPFKSLDELWDGEI
ncbi:non-functional NADPH-dependent codeinone reductase 2-like [Phoenix dactylifera]|uniref:Non-functional NADPH-dependent codeinone reductase 2-like n=1 Tax=Phoenix dactylifera TaxID=42345 RepID=A0A8B7C0P0_PHODC|nr:non-functional NADPH-dependent codeinone reductase 2-like [Phoenix dactylifera]